MQAATEGSDDRADPQDWYGTWMPSATAASTPAPSSGSPSAWTTFRQPSDLARRADGPARIMIHPQQQ